MKPTCVRSGMTCTMSPLSSAPAPPAPSRQCSTVPPAKCPPQRMSVSPSPSSRVSPSHSSMRAVGARDPPRVGGVQQHRAVEARAPSRPSPSSSAGARSRSPTARRGARSRRRSSSSKQRHAVPHHEALAERDEQRALADREPRLGADAGQLGVLAQLVAMRLRELVEASSSAGRPRGRTGARPRRSGSAAGGAAASGNWAAQVAQT